MSDWNDIIEPGRQLWAARLQMGDGKSDVKFAIGDLVSTISDEDLKRLDRKIANDLSHSKLRSYRDVAVAWPPESRVDASWTTHRTLFRHAKRFDLIRPRMTLREAQEIIGKIPADTRHPAKWDQERRVLFVIDQLQDAAVIKDVRAVLEERKKTRSAKAAVRMVEEDRSAEYREALRQLREARDAKHPEAAAYDALFKIREAAEYVRAVGKAGTGDSSFLPEHMKPSLAVALRDLASIAVDVIASMAQAEETAEEALAGILDHVTDLTKCPDTPIILDSVESFGVIE